MTSMANTARTGAEFSSEDAAKRSAAIKVVSFPAEDCHKFAWARRGRAFGISLN
jgi:hypothetical protein